MFWWLINFRHAPKNFLTGIRCLVSRLCNTNLKFWHKNLANDKLITRVTLMVLYYIITDSESAIILSNGCLTKLIVFIIVKHGPLD